MKIKVEKCAVRTLSIWRWVAVGLLTVFCTIGVSGPAVGGLVGGPSGTCVVTLDANGGTVSPTTVTFVTSGYSSPSGGSSYWHSGSVINITVFSCTIGDLPTPEFAGHVFLGWFTAADGGSQVGKGTSFSTTYSEYHVTYYAHWRLNEYTLRYLPNGGNGTMDNQMFAHGEQLVLSRNQYVRDGYAFAGWKLLDGTVVADGATLALNGSVDGEVVELVAQWSANYYKVTFNANGGTASTASKNVLYGGTYGSLPTPTRPGYAFAGWYTTAGGGAKVSAETKMTTAVGHSLYAHWSANSYMVTFDADGGVSPLASKSVRYDGNYGELPTPSRDDYCFDGWFTAKKGGTIVTAATKVSSMSDHKLYARWSPDLTNAYIVRLHRNYDGSNGDVVEDMIVRIGQGKALPTIADLGWTRKGCRFIGWVVGSGKDVIACFDGQAVKDLSITPGSIVPLYAGWR